MNKTTDLIEIIDNKCECEIYTFGQLEQVEERLRNMEFDIRLDLEGVLTLFQHNHIFDNKVSKCIISFVGKYSHTRSEARVDVQRRIQSGQVDYGFLIFRRCNNRRRIYHEVGSKAWLNNLFRLENVGIFIDDSLDHIISVNNLNIPNLETLHINNTDDENYNRQKIIEALQ